MSARSPLRLLSGTSARAKLLRAFLPVAPATVVGQLLFAFVTPFDPVLHAALAALLSGVLVLGVVLWSARGVTRDLELAATAGERSRRDAEQLAAIVESSSDAIYATSLDGLVIAWNASAALLFGYSPGEIIGRSVKLIALPGASDELEDSSIRIQAGGRVEPTEATRVHKDGSHVLVVLSESPVRNALGELVGISVIARDVSAERRAEGVLHDSQEKLRALFESDLVGIVFGDATGSIHEANDKFLRMVGYSRDELRAGLRWSALTPPEFQSLNDERVAEARERGACVPYEKQYIRKDGSRLWVLVGYVFLEPERERSVAFVLDIDDRKKAEAALRDSEQRFATIFRSNVVAIGMSELTSGRIVDVNERWAELFGYTRDEVIGRTVFDLGLWVDATQRQRITTDIAAGAAPALVEVAFRRKSGEERQALVSMQAVTLAGTADPLGIVAIVDVTDRKQLERRLLESEAEYRLLFDHNPHPMWVFDAETLAFLAVNDAAVRMYGFSREEFLGMTILDIRPPEEAVAVVEYLSTIAATPSLEAVHIRHRRKDGTPLEVAGTTNPIEFRGRRARLVMAQDVSEQRRLEAQLRQAQKMEAVGRLAGGVAHDFNNLLSVILGYTELLLRQPGDLHRGKLEQILRASERAASLTRQLLAFSRQQIVAPKVLDLNLLLSDLEPMLGRLIGEDVDVAILPGANLGLVKADPGQLEQVVMNLCVNARDAMPDGGLLRIETTNVVLDTGQGVGRPSLPAGRYVRLAVIDSGDGIPKELLPRLFEPFFTTKEPGKGTGLGLATVYGIVTQAGGEIEVRSEPGQGAVFEIHLPRIDEPLEEMPAQVVAPPPPPQGCETLLLVEDDQFLRAIALEVLEEQGYRVLSAASPKEAIELASRRVGPIDLLLTDVVMPGMNGRALAELLVAGRPALRVLYMSGYTADVVAQRGVLEPGTHLLEKPFAVRALLARVRAVLSDSTAEGGS